jgi:DNA adenine methylase
MCGDFRAVLRDAQPDDIVYMDPPYQGTSEGRDSRYFQGVPRQAIVEILEALNTKGVQYVLSYDGQCGPKAYGDPLPAHLNAQRVLLNTGRSSQATLNGVTAITLESIYLSPGLALPDAPNEPIRLEEFAVQMPLQM